MSQPKDTSQPSLHSKTFHFRALINKEGRLNVHGNRGRRNPFTDLYHYYLSLSWPKFFANIAAIYLFINVFFGGLYFIVGVDPLDSGHAKGLERFNHCVLLSIENMSAVDYSKAGDVSTGIYLLMAIQAFMGLITLAIMTGLFFVRFARPTSRIIFSNKAIISTHNGRLCFHFRIANERLNQIAEAHMGLHLTKNETSLEGEHMRKFYDLKLERDSTPLFALSWTVRHYIDDKSPLFGMDVEKMRQSQMGILASMTGMDETFAQPIIARHTYSLDDIVYNRRFKDIIVWHDKNVHIDLKGIHEVSEVNVR